MVIAVLKTSFNKIKPLNIIYRSYRNIDLDSFRNELNISLHACDTNSMQYDQFKAILMSIRNKYAHIKSETIRRNNRPFMNKTLSKSFVERIRLRSRYYKFHTKESYKIFKKQRNYCGNLANKTKKKYNNMNQNILKNNKKVWKASRPFISDKLKIFQKDFILVENEIVTSNATES